MIYHDLEVSYDGGTPKPSISMGFSLINHPFSGTPIYYGNLHSSEPPVMLVALPEQRAMSPLESGPSLAMPSKPGRSWYKLNPARGWPPSYKLVDKP